MLNILCPARYTTGYIVCNYCVWFKGPRVIKFSLRLQSQAIMQSVLKRNTFILSCFSTNSSDCFAQTASQWTVLWKHRYKNLRLEKVRSDSGGCVKNTCLP